MTGLSPAVLVLAKSPRPGLVKTRLVPPLTHEEAADVAAAALADTLEAVRRCGASRRVLALDGPAGEWLPEGFEVVPQRGESFAQRLQAAWSCAAGPTLQIGMDTPQVTAGLLDDSLCALAEPHVDAVLGPAVDGGWWALGLHRSYDRLFDGIPMSSELTGRAQATRLEQLGLRTTHLPLLRDVDTAADALAVAYEAPGGRFAGAVDRLLSAPGANGSRREVR